MDAHRNKLALGRRIRQSTRTNLLLGDKRKSPYQHYAYRLVHAGGDVGLVRHRCRAAGEDDDPRGERHGAAKVVRRDGKRNAALFRASNAQ
jgi:hypothetical protein